MRRSIARLAAVALIGGLVPVAAPTASVSALAPIVALTPAPSWFNSNVSQISNDGQWVLGLRSGTTPFLNTMGGTSLMINGNASGMSSDGRYVAVNGIGLYRYDRVLDTYTFVTFAPAGYSISGPAVISDDGQVMAYTVTENNPNPAKKVFVVTVGGTPVQQSNHGLTDYPFDVVEDITPDGRYLLYSANCKYPSCPTHGRGQGELRRVDRATNTTLKVSVNNAGVESNGGEGAEGKATISPNGRYVTFRSWANNLGVTTAFEGAIYVRDTVARTVTHLGPAPGWAETPFTTDSGLAIYPGERTSGDGQSTVFIRELATGHIRDVALDAYGNSPGGYVVLKGVSRNGKYLLLWSPYLLVPGSNSEVYIGSIGGAPLLAPSPNRILDTRNATGIPTTTPIPAGQAVTLQVGGVAGIPNDAAGAWLNVSIVSPQGYGYAKLYPCDNDPGEVSTVNYAPGGATANLAMVKLSATGTVCLWSSKTTHMLVDVQQAVTTFTPIAPVRLLDTRLPLDSPTPLTAMVARTLHVTGANGVVEGAEAVALNVTVINPSALGYLQAYPCGTTPTTSNGNFIAGRNKASFVIAQPDVDGNVCFLASANAHLAVDLVGHLPAVSTFEPSPGVRLHPSSYTLQGGRVVRLYTGQPANTTSLFGLVAVNPSVGGYVTVYTCGQPMPQVSALNFVPGGNTSNVTTMPNDYTGYVCIFVSQDVRLIVDYYGRF
ncbi:MAG: hypothetical protein ABMA25_10640 [Ilumatobacteraceae bacterium]